MVNSPEPLPPKMKFVPSAMKAMTARISIAKMTQSTPFCMVMPRMLTMVLNATNTMTHRYHGLPGMSATPQFATMTRSNDGTKM